MRVWGRRERGSGEADGSMRTPGQCMRLEMFVGWWIRYRSARFERRMAPRCDWCTKVTRSHPLPSSVAPQRSLAPLTSATSPTPRHHSTTTDNSNPPTVQLLTPLEHRPLCHSNSSNTNPGTSTEPTTLLEFNEMKKLLESQKKRLIEESLWLIRKLDWIG